MSTKNKFVHEVPSASRTLVNGQYQTLSCEKLIRIDHLVNQFCQHRTDNMFGVQRRGHCRERVINVTPGADVANDKRETIPMRVWLECKRFRVRKPARLANNSQAFSKNLR